MIEDLLSEETIKRRGLFRSSEVRRIIDRNLSGREDYSLHIFLLLNLELWQRQFIDGAQSSQAENDEALPALVSQTKSGTKQAGEQSSTDVGFAQKVN